MNEQILLALDQASQTSGWAIYTEGTLTKYGTITKRGGTPITRSVALVQEIDKLVKQYGVTNVVMEEIACDPNDDDPINNMHTFQVLAWVQSAIMIYCVENDIPYTTVTASHWRKECGIRTGRGIKRATLKAADKAFVQCEFALTVSEDEADAIGIGYSQIKEKRSAW